MQQDFDSLPYIDSDLDLSKAQELIQLELGNSKDKIQIATSQYDVKINPTRPAKIENGINIAKFQLVPTKNDYENVQNAKAQYEYQQDRLMNLELLQKYGQNEFKIMNDKLSSIIDNMELELSSLEQEITNVNQKRRMEQEIGRKKLESMREKRMDLYGEIVQVRMANNELQ